MSFSSYPEDQTMSAPAKTDPNGGSTEHGPAKPAGRFAITAARIFWPALIIIVGAVLVAIIFPDATEGGLT